MSPIAGADPSGQDSKKGITIETTLAADCGVSYAAVKKLP